MAKRPPRLGGELPAYTTMTPKKPRKSLAQALQNTVSGLAKSGYGSKNYVQQPPKPIRNASTYGSTPIKDGTLVSKPKPIRNIPRRAPTR